MQAHTPGCVFNRRCIEISSRLRIFRRDIRPEPRSDDPNDGECNSKLSRFLQLLFLEDVLSKPKVYEASRRSCAMSRTQSGHQNDRKPENLQRDSGVRKWPGRIFACARIPRQRLIALSSPQRSCRRRKFPGARPRRAPSIQLPGGADVPPSPRLICLSRFFSSAPTSFNFYPKQHDATFVLVTDNYAIPYCDKLKS